ncbi:hypothetical protein BDA99DRAFT_556072 [Phascolomyces articulosus]|uniref:Uncharacterized protein n=1 Tax=Phascolomyces articulosus TaxID=60185 RepID=A0AAD5KKH7_9FUNG|nr:hypothetical protein BDA99DRAFT_556072 [Phascolomyces articulosus]
MAKITRVKYQLIFVYFEYCRGRKTNSNDKSIYDDDNGSGTTTECDSEMNDENHQKNNNGEDILESLISPPQDTSIDISNNDINKNESSLHETKHDDNSKIYNSNNQTSHKIDKNHDSSNILTANSASTKNDRLLSSNDQIRINVNNYESYDSPTQKNAPGKPSIKPSSIGNTERDSSTYALTNPGKFTPNHSRRSHA